MPLYDADAGAQLLGDIELDASNPHASAAAAYTAWAAAIGVSDTAAISSFDGDDSIFQLPLGFAALDGSAYNSIGVSTESGLMLYAAPPANTAQGAMTSLSYESSAVSRMFMTVSRPSLLLAARVPTLDGRIELSKWQKSGTTAILFYRFRDLSAQTEIIEVAARITPARIELVLTNINANSPKLQQFQFRQSANWLVDGRMLNSGFAGTVAYSSVAKRAVSGVVRDAAGQPAARTVRTYRRDTGRLLGAAISDAATGVYSVPCFYSGEVQRVVLDDDAGTLYNDVIDRVIPG